jgi:hypothetical protein
MFLLQPPLGISFIGLLWVAYALLGFFDSVHNYIGWKILMIIKIYQGGIYQCDIGVAAR